MSPLINQVRRAQHLGASGVIIADNTCLCKDVEAGTCQKPDATDCEQVEPIMADDGSGADIAIPRCVYVCVDLETDENRYRHITGGGWGGGKEEPWLLTLGRRLQQWGIFRSWVMGERVSGGMIFRRVLW